MNPQNNVPVPVLFSSDGSIVIVGGVSGSARILDSGSCETLQVLPHDGQFFQSPFSPRHQLITTTGDMIQAIVRLSNQPVSLAHTYQDSCVTPDGIRIIAAGVSERGSETTIRVWTARPAPEPRVPPSRSRGRMHDREPPPKNVTAPAFLCQALLTSNPHSRPSDVCSCLASSLGCCPCVVSSLLLMGTYGTIGGEAS